MLLHNVLLNFLNVLCSNLSCLHLCLIQFVQNILKLVLYFYITIQNFIHMILKPKKKLFKFLVHWYRNVEYTWLLNITFINIQKLLRMFKWNKFKWK